MRVVRSGDAGCVDTGILQPRLALYLLLSLSLIALDAYIS